MQMLRQLEAIQFQCSDRAKNAMSSDLFRVGIRNEADADEAELLVYGVIGDGLGDEDTVGATSVERFLNTHRDRKVHVRFHTPGGLAWDGIVIHNALLRHKALVRGTIEGVCASAGTIIAAACDRLEMYENSRYMIHRAWAPVAGNSEDMLEYAELLNQTDRQIARTLAARAGATESHIYDLMCGKVDGTYMLAEDAVREGLVDGIIKLDRDTKNEAPNDPQAVVAAAREREIAANRAAADRLLRSRNCGERWSEIEKGLTAQ